MYEEWEIDAEEGLPVLKKDQKEREKPLIKINNFVMPGEKICIANEYYEAGEGAYEFGSSLYASIAGYISVQEYSDQELTVVSIKRKDGSPPFVAPYVGAVVTCTVISRTDRLARCLITHVKGQRLREGIRGIIRREYISPVQRDLFEIVKSFGLGDVVLARVVGISEGDFIMSTAEDGLGVASAVGESGSYLVPVGWLSMEDPRTKVAYPRKVAKIIQDKNIEYWQERNFKKNLKDILSNEIKQAKNNS